MLALLASLLVALHSGEAPDPDARALDRWLALSPTERIEKRAAFIAQAQQSGARVVATALGAAGSTDLRAIAVVDGLAPTNPAVACWCGVQQARLLLRNARVDEAVAALLNLRDASPTVRLKYEVVLGYGHLSAPGVGGL